MPAVQEHPQGVLTFRDGETVLAVVLRNDYEKDGLSFFTPDSFSMQLGYMKHPAGWVIKAHQHKQMPRTIHATCETLFVKSGRVAVQLYGLDGTAREQVELRTGDFILLVAGGHGFQCIETTEMIEVKQGPYLGTDDKTPL